MKKKKFNIIKASGQEEEFSYEKYRNSLKKSGADDKTIDEIIKKIQPFFKEGLTTHEIYKKTYALLKKEDRICASRYSLKESLRRLGPTGFPFEHLVGEIFKRQGYTVRVGDYIPGKCVDHEIDVLGIKDEKYILVEVKFHNQPGTRSHVQTPLYVKARFDDLIAHKGVQPVGVESIDSCIIVTNTKFTNQAITYGECVGIRMLAWGYPSGKGLERIIDSLKIYPITVLTNLRSSERKTLLENNIVLCEQLEEVPSILKHLGITEKRKDAILQDCKQLCR